MSTGVVSNSFFFCMLKKIFLINKSISVARDSGYSGLGTVFTLPE